MLAHEHPVLCARLATRVLAAGQQLVVHLDRKAPETFRARFEAALDGPREAVLWAPRERVRWGEWSMVEATLNGLRALRDGGHAPDHVYLLSGADYPIRPIAQLRDFLARHPHTDFIEHQDGHLDRWVRRGPQRERFEFWHRINWRTHPRLFSASLTTQRLMRVRRRFPEGLHPFFGSQWWVLTGDTCHRALTLAEQPEVRRFFRYTWVPDELFFQSVVGSLVPTERRVNRHLTHYQFTASGVPVEFHDGHDAYLSRQPFFFARKLSPRAHALRDALDRFASQAPAPPLDDRVGEASGEYERFLHEQRNGVAGQRCWGITGVPGLGQMERNRRPYRVIAAASDRHLEAAREALAGEAELVSHGRLFAEDRIGYGDGAEPLPGFEPHDTALRDHDRLDFLAELLRAGTGRMTVFTWRLTSSVAADRKRSRSDLLSVLARDPNCEIVHLGNRDEDERHFGAVALPPPHPFPAKVRATWSRLDPPPTAEPARAAWEQALRRVVTGSVVKHEDDAPTPDVRRPRRLVLHIGVHRTGTTAIQRHLHRNRKALRAQGVHYAFDTENHTSLARELQGSDADADRLVDRIVADADAAGQPVTVISGEDLCRIPWVNRLARLREHFEVQVICYLRRQDGWLESWYNQHVRWPWELDSSTLTPDEFLADRRHYHWIRYDDLLMRWSEVFGDDALTVRVFEEVVRAGSLTADLCRQIGIDPARLDPVDRPENASVSPRATEILRHLRLFGRPPRDRVLLIRAVAEAATAAGLDETAHVFSERQRANLLRGYTDGNAWVARTFLGRPDGRLFPQPPPGDDPTPPNLSLPSPKAFLHTIGRPLVTHCIDRALSIGPDFAVDPSLDDRLFRLEWRHRRLRARIAEVRGRLNLGRGPARDGADNAPGPWDPVSLPAGGAPHHPLADTLAQALGDELAPRERAVLERLLNRWSRVMAAREVGEDTLTTLPADTERLLDRLFLPLLDVCLADLSRRRLLRRWGPDGLEAGLAKRNANTDRMEARLRALRSTLAAPVRRAHRLLRRG